jgi:hypothetical protein
MSYHILFYSNFITAQFQLFNLNGTKGLSDNRKCWIIQNAKEKDEGK